MPTLDVEDPGEDLLVNLSALESRRKHTILKTAFGEGRLAPPLSAAFARKVTPLHSLAPQTSATRTGNVRRSSSPSTSSYHVPPSSRGRLLRAMNVLTSRCAKLAPLTGNAVRLASSVARLPDVHKKNWKEDVVYLYQFPPARVVPNLSPYCLKVHTYLKAQKIPHEVISSWKMRSAKGFLPFVELNGHQIADSQLILSAVQKTFGIKENLSTEEAAVARAVDRMIEGSMFFTILYPKMIWNPEKYLHREVTNLPLPGFVTNILAKSFVKKVKRRFGGVGYGRFSKEELRDILRRDLEAIDGILGDKKFLFGDKPVVPDFTLFGHLATTYYLPYRQPLGDFLDDDFPRVLNHMLRMRAHYWPEWKDPK
uniref:GST N-terminal domain-containing protein n=1 Tax=Steinernema glaseri TaxID=37863 RepID=A0A1I7YVB8_9BILA